MIKQVDNEKGIYCDRCTDIKWSSNDDGWYIKLDHDPVFICPSCCSKSSSLSDCIVAVIAGAINGLGGHFN